MNKNSTTHKAEGLGKSEQNRIATQFSSVPQFENEQQFLDGLKSFMQAGRESRAPGIERIARFWERKITFSILVTQQRQKRLEAARLKRAALKLQVSVATNTAATAFPSSLRIRVNASPSPD